MITNLVVFHLSITIYCPSVFDPMQRISEWLSSTETHDSQDMSIENLSSDILPDWFTAMCLCDTYLDMNDDKAHSVMQIDQKFSAEFQISCAIEDTINEKPRPNFNLPKKKSKTPARRKPRKSGWSLGHWPPLLIENAKYIPPSRQSSPRKSPPTPNTSPIIARHRKKLLKKKINFDIQ